MRQKQIDFCKLFLSFQFLANLIWCLSSVSLVISGCESLTPTGRNTNPSQVNQFPADTGTHLPTPEGWKAELAQAEKKVTRRFNRDPAELGSNWGRCGQKAEILPTAPNMPAQIWSSLFARRFFQEAEISANYILPSFCLHEF